jgi:AraC-like DNA-binding protein/ligand-binding sensor protein
MNAAPATSQAFTLQQSRALVAQLKQSRIYRDYEQAFRESTGLPLALRPIEAFDLPHQDDPKASPFCALMARSNKSCAACLQFQRHVEEEAGLEPKTLRCFAGLCDSAVPVRVGQNLVAFLQTGQVLLHKPNSREFTAAARQLVEWGAEIDVKRYEEAYFQTRVVSKKQYESIVRLLTIFGEHLAALSNRLMVEGEDGGMPSIAKARALITERYAERLSLTDMARAVNMSAFYFCKSFKRVTGMTFTDYLARVRIERVKNLLLDPSRRVSEAAYEAGFQSLSQFNRVFRRVAGESPTVYRERLHGSGEG